MAEALGKRSIAWTNEHTTEENKAFLRQLLKQIPLQLGDLRVMSSVLINLHNIIGAVMGGVYNFIRHPQYASLIVSSFGMLLLMRIFRCRFINQ